MLKIVAPITMVALLTCAESAAAQQCTPGPRCRAIGERAAPIIQNQQARQQGGGAAESAAASYCVSMIVAETSRICAAELESSGEANCAGLARQQMEALLNSAEGAKAASRELSASSMSWQARCGW
jgi:hypothetical protein